MDKMNVTANFDVEVNNLLIYLKQRSQVPKVGMANYNEVQVEKLALVQAAAVIETLLAEREQKKEYKCPPVVANRITPKCYGRRGDFNAKSSSCKNCQFYTDCKTELEISTPEYATKVVEECLGAKEQAKEELFGGRKQKSKKYWTKSIIHPKCFGDYDVCNSDARTCRDCECYKDCLVATRDANVWDDKNEEF